VYPINLISSVITKINIKASKINKCTRDICTF